VEIAIDIIRSYTLSIFWILPKNIVLYTHPLLKEQGVLYSRPTVIIPS